jgi:hypothetical protein
VHACLRFRAFVVLRREPISNILMPFDSDALCKASDSSEFVP